MTFDRPPTPIIERSVPPVGETGSLRPRCRSERSSHRTGRSPCELSGCLAGECVDLGVRLAGERVDPGVHFGPKFLEVGAVYTNVVGTRCHTEKPRPRVEHHAPRETPLSRPHRAERPRRSAPSESARVLDAELNNQTLREARPHERPPSERPQIRHRVKRPPVPGPRVERQAFREARPHERTEWSDRRPGK